MTDKMTAEQAIGIIADAACAFDGDVDGAYKCRDIAISELATLRERVKVLEANYNELLYQVAEKIPGESRHETALNRLRHYNNVPGQPEAARLRGGSDE